MNHLPLPTARQEEWADLELGVIIHHVMDVYHPDIPFSESSVSTARMPAESFAPDAQSTDQWLACAADMGAKYAVLVANHGTGFSLWPTRANDYSVAHSAYPGDIVAEFIASCRKYGVRPGLYYSTVSNAFYGLHNSQKIDYLSESYQAYVQIVNRQLTELWSQYGELFEIWFDGGVVPKALGGPDVPALLQKYQPGAVCFQGPSGHRHNLRWIGNENGLASMDCWSTVRTDSTGFGDDDHAADVGQGDPDGDHWIPAETDMANRRQSAFGGGWFWAENEDGLVYPAEELMDAYLTSVGRNSNLLLGMCIDRHGRFPEADARQFARFGEMVRGLYRDPAGTCRGTGAGFEVALDEPQPIRHIVLAEDIHYGQRVRRFHLELDTPEGTERFFEARSIGHKRIIPVNRSVRAARLIVDEAADTPILREMTLYR